ncbi:uncharacterized protein LOC127705624 [Mytilus californianus]|uniref:uncharacterized protein LOC127705624 n=1 Tax=Mytilus californianus TaxID=6549 RepID=UPI002246EC3A|nr:uncharacterized protein LOC127705624 [Mytilus californianus]
MKQLYVVEDKENSKICQLLSSLEKKEKEIADCQRNIMNIKKHATDLQMFLSMKQIEIDVYSNNTFLQSLVEGEGQHSLSYKINTSIQNIMADIISFGEVRIESKPFDIVLIKKKTKQAQMMVPTVQSSPFENIKLTIHKTINTKDFIYGCCMLPGGRIAFTYYFAQTVKVFSDKGSTDFEMKMPCSPFDIIYISEDNTLAVTSGVSKKHCITIIDIRRKQIKKTISLDSSIDGIALKNNTLIYSSRDIGIRMINLYDESISDLVRDAMPSECYTSTFRDNIYYTKNVTNTVICYNLQGKVQWTFHNESVLRNPRGIDVDNDGNVYVAGYRSNNVVVISPDGQRHREVCTARDGLIDPFTLHYSGPTNQLLVANFNKNKSFLFNCT